MLSDGRGYKRQEPSNLYMFNVGLTNGDTCKINAWLDTLESKSQD